MQRLCRLSSFIRERIGKHWQASLCECLGLIYSTGLWLMFFRFLCQVEGCTRMEPWSCLAAFPFSLKMSCCWQMAYQIIFVHLIISACWLALAWRSPASERVSVGSLSLKKSVSEYSSWGSGLHNLLFLVKPSKSLSPLTPLKKQGWESWSAFCIGILWVSANLSCVPSGCPVVFRYYHLLKGFLFHCFR